MNKYELYTAYAMRFGLTFIPKGLDALSWKVAIDLMTRALDGNGPIVTHNLIRQRATECLGQEGGIAYDIRPAAREYCGAGL